MRKLIPTTARGERGGDHFRDLDWRIETRVASRALLEQETPFVTIKLHLDTEPINENKEKLNAKGDDKSTQRQVALQVDPGHLRGMIQSLEEAILGSKSRSSVRRGQ